MNTQSTAARSTRAWIDIDLGALLRNGEALARHARVPLVPMIKADAYGLGAVEVARTLTRLDPFGFGVATVDEGRELRDAGVSCPVLVFTPLLPDEFVAARAARLTPALAEPVVISTWSDTGGGAWHLAIDTGMNRAGVRWDAIASVAAVARRLPPEGAFTHFHSSELDDGSMALQEHRFREAVDLLAAGPLLLHTDNSAAIVRRLPMGDPPWSLVRPGVFLYGVGSGALARLTPEPVVSVRARVVELRDVRAGESASYDASWTASRPSRIATLAIGYADGYRRSLGNTGSILLNGTRVPVVGTVTMDMTMVDVTGVRCEVGDAATLIGSDGASSVTLEDTAVVCGLSPYEILTGLRQRLPRNYV